MVEAPHVPVLLRPLLAAWGRLPGVRRVELGPLPDDDVRALVGGLTEAPASAAELQDLVERAEGNAFFAEELAAAIGTSDTPRDLADLLLLRVDVDREVTVVGDENPVSFGELC